MYSETRGKIHFWSSLIFFNLTFFPMHFLGLLGMPRRISDDTSAFAHFNIVETIDYMSTVVSVAIVYVKLLWLNVAGIQTTNQPGVEASTTPARNSL